MPIVELDINGTPTRVQVSDGYQPDDLDHIAQSLSGPQESAVSRATSYVGRKAKEWQQAADTMLGGLSGVAPPEHPPTDPWEIAGQTATALAPAIAPEATALGTTLGAYARAKGADEPTADVVNAATQLGSGVLRAGQAAAGVKAATSARFGGVRDALVSSGKLMAADSPEGQQLFWDLGRVRSRFPAGTGERQAATRIMGLLARGAGLTYGDVDDALTLVQGGKKASAVAGVLRGARRSIAAGTPEAGELAGAEQSARLNRMSLPNLLPSRLAGLGRGAAVAGSIGEAGRQAYHGNYGRAAATAGAGLLGVGSVGQGLAALGPLARTGVAVGGQIPSLAAGQASQNAPAERTEPDTAPAAPEEAPSPTQALKPLPGPFGREIAAVASLAGVPPQLIQSHMKVESGGNPAAIGDQGRSIGLMQIQPGTASQVAQHAGELLGRAPDLRNPLDNLLVGGLLLRRYLDKTNGDVGAAAQMYNGGEHTSGNPMTRVYAGKIIENFAGGG